MELNIFKAAPGGGGGSSVLKTKRFETDGTFTVPKDVHVIYVSGAGGGGGGAGGYCSRNNAAISAYYALPGYSGDFLSMYPVRVQPGQVLPVTIGVGGNGGIGGLIKATVSSTRTYKTGVAGTKGTNTILGDVLLLNGGAGGLPSLYASSYSSKKNNFLTQVIPIPSNQTQPYYILSRGFTSIDKVNSNNQSTTGYTTDYFAGLRAVRTGIWQASKIVSNAHANGGVPSAGSPLEVGTGANGGSPSTTYRNFDVIGGAGQDATQFGTGGGGGGGAGNYRGRKILMQGGKGGDGKQGFLEIFW